MVLGNRGLQRHPVEVKGEKTEMEGQGGTEETD